MTKFLFFLLVFVYSFCPDHIRT